MRGEAAWQIDVRPAGVDSPDTLLVVLGGRWRIDQDLPSADTLKASLAAPIRRLGFETSGLTDWDSGLLTFVAGISKSSAGMGIAVDGSGLPPGAQRLLAMASAVPEQKLAGRPAAPQGPFVQVGEATLEFVRGAPQMLGFLGEVVLSLRGCFPGVPDFAPATFGWRSRRSDRAPCRSFP